MKIDLLAVTLSMIQVLMNIVIQVATNIVIQMLEIIALGNMVEIHCMRISNLSTTLEAIDKLFIVSFGLFYSTKHLHFDMVKNCSY